MLYQKLLKIINFFNSNKKELTWENKMKMLKWVSQFEGDFWTSDADFEYEGVYDEPKRDKFGNKIPKEKRMEYEGFSPHRNSKYGKEPNHVGLSWGFVQFTQRSGGLGLVLQQCYDDNPDLFKKIFGKEYFEILQLTNSKATPTVKEPDDNALVKWSIRCPRTKKINGKDLWESPFIERFIEAGKQEIFQRSQLKCAVNSYMKTAIGNCKLYNITSEKGLLITLDRTINSGGKGCRDLYDQFLPKSGSEEERFKQFYENIKNRGWSHRVQKALETSEFSFENLIKI